MKRGTFKRKKSPPLKRTPFKPKKRPERQIEAKDAKIKTDPTKKKRRKKTVRKKLEEDLWELCRKLTFKRYGNMCYTTGAMGLEGTNLQCGHGKPKGALPLKYQYDLRNLRPQSYHANMNLGGMSDVFIAKMEREKDGLSFLEECCVKIDGVWKIKDYETMGSLQAEEFLRAKIAEYKLML